MAKNEELGSGLIRLTRQTFVARAVIELSMMSQAAALGEYPTARKAVADCTRGGQLFQFF